MKFVCTLLLFIPVFVFAQSSRPGTVLWKITSPGGKVSYMMGTNHSYGGTFVDTLPRVKALLSGAECLVMESVKENNIQPVKPDFNGKTPYSKLFSAADYRMMDSVVASYEMNTLHELDSVHYPPHMLAMHFTAQFMNEKDGRMKAEDDAMDHYIHRYAEKQNIPVAGLDSGFTVREGILQFGLTEQQWADAMVKLFRAKISGETIMSDVDGTYGAMNTDYQFKEQQPHKTGSDAHHLLVDRNTYWMKRLPGMLEQKRCFVAVGIAHLSYKNGLLMELKKRGFKIEPIKVLPTAEVSFRSSQTD